MSNALSEQRRRQLRERLQAEGFRTEHKVEVDVGQETTDRRIAGRLIAQSAASGLLTWAFPIPEGEEITNHITAALLAVVKYHPDLRTTIIVTDSGLQREVLPPESIFTPVMGEPTTAKELAATPIDLAIQSPLRVRILPGLLVISAHHAVADEHTWELLLTELNAEINQPGCITATATAYDAPASTVAQATQRRVNALAATVPELHSRPDPFAATRISSAEPAAERITLAVSPEWVTKLHNRAKTAGTTALTALLQAGARVLSRRENTDNTSPIMVGTPADVRVALGDDANWSDGDRVSIVPMAIPPTAKLDEVGTIVTTALADRCAGLEDIIQKLELAHEVGRSPLIDVVITHRRGTRELTIAGESYRGEFLFSGAAAFDVVLTLEENPTGPSYLSMEYRRCALPSDTAALFLSEWRDAAIADDDVSHKRYPSTPPTTVDFWADVCTLVAQHAHMIPMAVAIRDENNQLSYAQLYAAAMQLANYLHASGLRPGDVVALRLSRGVSIPVAMLAALYAATPFVCIDPQHPQKRSEQILATAKPARIIEDVDVARCLQQMEIPASSVKPPSYDPQLPAYLVFTSGTTGVPKGVVLSRAALDSVLGSLHKTLSLQPQDIYLAASTLGFDISIVENLLALVAGSCVYIAPAEFSTDIDYACTLLATVRPTIVEATPSLWSEIIHHDPTVLRGITACAGGEALPQKLAMQLRAAGAEVFNLYGPSETAIVATAHQINDDTSSPPLGCALPTIGAEILDPLLRPTPDGALGELYLSGVQVGFGYLQDPVKTAASFVAAPGGKRRYRSGDMVVRDVKKQLLHYVGRGDEQLSLHGIRIERGEIEAALTQVPGIAGAAVRVITDNEAIRIIGYVVPESKGTEPISETSVLTAVAKLLPGVARPSKIVVLSSFPRTATGKVDLAQLPLPDETIMHRHQDPATPEEHIVVQAVQEVLGLDYSPSADADFRALGGHSLLAHRLALKLSAALETTIKVRTVLEEPNLAMLAAACADIRNKVATAKPVISDENSADPYAPLPGQRRIVLAEQYDNQDGLYTIPLFSTVNGPIDIQRLARALTHVLAAHPVLRSRLSLDSAGEIQATVLSVDQVLTQPITISQLSTSEANLSEFLLDLVQSAFLAVADCPLRVYVIQVQGQEEPILALLFHHAFFDEWSLDPFFADLKQAYDSDTVLPERTPSFSTLQAITQFRDPNDLEFWQLRAAKWPTQSDEVLPFSRKALAEAGHANNIVKTHGATIHRFIEIDLAVDSANILRSAVLVLLARSGCDPVIGIPVSGRHDPRLIDVIGYLGNTLPMYIADASRLDLPITDFVATVREETRNIADHSSIPVEELSGLANFQVLVDHRVGTPPVASTTEWTSTFLPVIPPIPKLPLTIMHTEVPQSQTQQSHRIDVLFSGEHFEATGADAFMTALRGIITGIEQALLHKHPEHHVLGHLALGSVHSVALLPKNKLFRSVPEFLDQQCAAHPDDVMLSTHDRVFHGSELRRHIRQTAKALIHALDNAPRGKVIAIHQRSRFDEVLSILSILASGAAFTVLRPEDPADRIATVLSDSQAVLVISDDPDSLPPNSPSIFANSNPPEDTPLCWPELHDPAYMVFTSGTTGRPKGVLVDHRALSGLMDFTFELLDSTAKEKTPSRPRLVSIAPMSFDVGLLEVISTLCVGGHLYIATDTERFGAPLVAAVAKHRATHFAATPTVLSLLGSPSVLSEDVIIFSGAEPLPVDLAHQWAARHQVINLYGPTEATVNAVHGFVTSTNAHSSIPIGIADPLVTAVVLDHALQPVPPGMVGELWLAGPKLALGYPALPELTALSFIAAPMYLGLAPGSRMYRTGDLAAQYPDGTLLCLGRIDDQIKVRGLRIEPAEIESVLRTHSAISDARVLRLSNENTGGRDMLVAAVTSMAGALSSEQLHSIRQDLAEALPKHLVPQRLIQLPELPVTSNGKADRAATALMVTEALTARTGTAAPSDSSASIENSMKISSNSSDFSLIAEEVAGLLDIPVLDIQPEDDFLELGGDSILALQLTARLKDRGWQAHPREIFQTRTLGELAELISPIATTAMADTQQEVAEIGTFSPVRVAAEHAEAAPESLFAQSMLLRLPHSLSGKTSTLITALIAQYPSLRTRIIPSGECETLATADAYHHPVKTELLGSAASEKLAALRRELAHNLDVRNGVLVAEAEVTTDIGPMLLLVIHHMAIDAASWPLLIADLEAFHRKPEILENVTSVGTSPRKGAHRIAQTSTQQHALPLLRNRIITGKISAEDIAATAAHSSTTLSDDLSTALLQRFGQGAQLRDVLITAVAQAARTIDPWGPQQVTIDVETHGRDEFIDPRSVGWWTSIVTMIDSPHERLESLPTQNPVPPEQRSDILLNHLGAMFQPTSSKQAFAPSPLPELPAVDAIVGDDVPLRNALSITSVITESQQIRLTFIRAARLLSDEVLTKLQRALVAELQGLIGLSANEHTPEQLLPVTPTQEGMFYLWEHGVTGTEAYLTRMTFVLDGVIDPELILATWSRLCQRHPVLRSRFYRGANGAVRAVLDFSAELDAHWDDDYTEADMLHPFDLTVAPLARLRVKRISTSEHVIDVVFHHILADGWSAPLMIRDFFQLLDPNQPVDVIDPVPALAAARNHDLLLPPWRKVLRSAKPTKIMPYGEDRGSRTELRFQLDHATSQALVSVAQKQHLTVAALLHGAWAEVLADLTTQSKVTFGSVIAGRPLDVPSAQNVVGLFATTIPITIDVSKSDPYAASRAASELLLLGAENPPVLAEAQQLVEQEEKVTELFDSLLVIENYPLDQSALLHTSTDISVKDLSFQDGTHYPVMVVAHIADTVSLRIALADGMSLISNQSIHQLAANLERHLRNLAGTALLVEKIQGVPMTGPLPILNPAQSPDQLAIHRFSAAQSQSLIVTIAAKLQSAGIGPGDYVALGLPRGIEHVCATLAIWLAGAATMPVEVDEQMKLTTRSRKIVDSAKPTLLLDAIWLEELHIAQAASVFIEPTAAKIRNHRTRRLLSTDPAYVIHTSGTTGTPKGVVVPWSVMEQLITWQQAADIVPAETIVAHFAPDQFDVSMQELLTAVVGHHPLVIVPESIRSDMKKLARFFDAEGVDVLFATSTVLNALAREYAHSGCPSLSVLIQAGESLQPSPELQDWCVQSFGPKLYNQYGPSETHVVIATGDLSQELTNTISLGKPLPHVTALVLDSQQAEVAPGYMGELYIGGPLATGYLGDYELTKERFPELSTQGMRFHRTGDLVIQQPDGSISYCGRADDQMKIKGVRIAPNEVIAIARLLPEVSEAVAFDDAGVLCLAVVPFAGAHITADYIRDHFEQHTGNTTSPFIPENILSIAALPLTDNAKTDFRTLRSWLHSERSTTQRHGSIASESASVELITGIMADVLSEQQGKSVHIHPDADFLAFGGHSLSATRLSGRLSTALGMDLSLRVILEQRTPRNIAAALTGTDITKTQEHFAALYDDHVPLPGAYIPASPAQRRFWALSQLNADDITYNLPLLVQLQPESTVVEIEALTQTITDRLRALVIRHEALRTLITGSIDGPLQVVLDPNEAASRITVPVFTEEQAFHQYHRQAFQLDIDLPLRAAVHPGDDGIILSLVIHHVACDGWSLSILFDDLAALWNGIDLPEVKYQSPAAIMAAHSILWDMSGQAEQDHQYWDHQLDELPCPMPLPLDRPRHTSGKTKGRLLSFELSNVDHDALVQAAKNLDATPFMVFHAAVAATLSRLGCGNDIVLGTPVSGRQGGVDDSAIGCFINLLVLRTSLSGNPTITEIISRIRNTNLQAVEHAAMPFEELVRKHASGASTTHHPLVTVGIGLQKLPTVFPAPHGYRATPIGMDPEVARFDLNFDLFLGDENVSPRIVTEFNVGLFDQSTITRMSQRILRFIHTAATTAETTLRALPLLLDDEREALRLPAPMPPQPSASIANLMRGLVDHGGVLGHDGIWLSATELQSRIDEVAQLLVQENVQPGDVVGIACRRSVGQLIAQLAVLRIGAVYAPFLLDTPPQRLKNYIDQCDIKVLLCTYSSDLVVDDALTIIDVGIAGLTTSAASSVPLLHAREISSDTPAYVLFTSGSTGIPKGVLVARRNVEAMLAGTSKLLPLTPADIMLALSPFCFDVTGWEYLAPLAAGSRLIIADDDQHRNPRSIAKLIHEYSVTHCEATPGLWALIAEATEYDLTGVHAVMSGEALPPAVGDAVRARGGSVWNLYGPTEATVFATGGQQSKRNIDIGLPLPSVQIKVLDDALVPVPYGGIGDLYLVGSQIAYGYRGQPDLTTAAFVANPDGDGTVMYRTGDVVQQQKDGTLTYLGRRDQQVQLRGHRVELGEVVSALLELPGITQAAAKILYRGGAVTLVGYVTAEDLEVDTSLLLQKLRLSLPDYLIPAQLVQLVDLPYTANGKVDVHRLPDPEPEEWQAPATDTEKLLARIIAELLESDIPSRNQGFVSLGGDSITAIRLAARASEQGLHITIQDVLSTSTIAELAALADSRPQTSFTAEETDDHVFGDLSGLSATDLSKVLGAFGDNDE